jgi:ubiquinone/menaquinone biosynthesis C-methylase UbiE
LWGILSEPQKKFQKWNEHEFLLRGENEVAYLMHCAKTLGYPQNWDAALDYGCGVGRVTLPLSKYFQKCYGMDISEVMIQKAKIFSKDMEKPPIYLNDVDLEQFPDGTFDLVYSMLVLQHIPQRSMSRNYIKEFVRVLKQNGLLIFQVPTHIPLSNRFRIWIGEKFYRILNIAGMSNETLYNKYGLLPVVLNYIEHDDVRSLITSQQGKVLDVKLGPNFNGVSNSTYYVTK